MNKKPQPNNAVTWEKIVAYKRRTGVKMISDMPLQGIISPLSERFPKLKKLTP